MVTVNNSINNTVGGSNSGVTNTLTVTNSSNTGSSQANMVIDVGGGLSGDPFKTYTVTGLTNWSNGIDNSVTDNFTLSASTALGTTDVMSVFTSGEINYPLQPAVFAYLLTDISNITGNNATYTVIFDTEVFDQNADFDITTGIFTAPVTGRYWINFQIKMLQATNATTVSLQIVTSNRTYNSNNTIAISPATFIGNLGVLGDLDAADTCTVTINLNGIGANTADVDGGANPFTHFSISLNC